MSQQQSVIPAAGPIETPSDFAAPGTKQAPGRVCYVGVGFANPDWLTLAGAQLLAEADLIVLDEARLEAVISHPYLKISPHTRVLTLSEDDTPTARIGLLVREAALGRLVVRLVVGDPLIDANAGYEAIHCAQAGCTIEVLPGVSTAVGIATLAGVEPTPGMGFCTFSAPGEFRGELPVEFPALLNCTVATIPTVLEAAVRGGRSLDEEVLLTVAGGTGKQRSHLVPLSELATAAPLISMAADDRINLVLGPGAHRNPALNCWESKPLLGWRVLVPRTRETSERVDRRLRAYGASFHAVPTIDIKPPRDPGQLERAIQGLVDGRYRWVVFTSSNAVRGVFDKLSEYGLDTRAFSGTKVAAMTPQAAVVLAEWGIRADLSVQQRHTGAALLSEFPEFAPDDDPIDRVFLPRADVATEAIADGLGELGWQVENVLVYRTVRADPPPAHTRLDIKTGGFDAVLFTSSSTVRNLVGIAGKPPASTVIAAIGELTAQTCQEYGLRVDVVADRPDQLALVDALANYASQVQTRADEKAMCRPSRQ